MKLAYESIANFVVDVKILKNMILRVSKNHGSRFYEIHFELISLSPFHVFKRTISIQRILARTVFHHVDCEPRLVIPFCMYHKQ